MNERRRATAVLTSTVTLFSLACAGLVLHAQTQAASAGATRTPQAIYEASCMSCHGPDGRGQPKAVVGFEDAIPDFTDCPTSTAERDADWHTIVSNGGPIRGFTPRCPPSATCCRPRRSMPPSATSGPSAAARPGHAAI